MPAVPCYPGPVIWDSYGGYAVGDFCIPRFVLAGGLDSAAVFMVVSPVGRGLFPFPCLTISVESDFVRKKVEERIKKAIPANIKRGNRLLA